LNYDDWEPIADRAGRSKPCGEIMIRWVFRWLFRLLILCIVLAVAAVLLMDTVARALLERHVSSATGLDARIGKVEIGLFNSKFRLENLVIYNAAEFGGSPMVSLPELYLEYDGSAVGATKLSFKLVRFNLAELTLVKSKDGKGNIEDLVSRIEKHRSRTTVKPVLEFGGISNLNLTLGKVRQIDLARPDQPSEIALGVQNEIQTNITSVKDLENRVLAILIRRGANGLFQTLFVASADSQGRPRRSLYEELASLIVK
jgi:uncharacterized protein involved in outer membrane biogenesis